MNKNNRTKLAVILFLAGSSSIFAQAPATPQPVGDTKAPVPASSVRTLAVGDDSILNTRVGAGISFTPNTYAALANIEWRVDEHFAIGPMLQAGFSAETTYYLPTVVGRFIVPHSYWKKQMNSNMEASILAGLGQNFREVQGFRFNDFVYQFGMNVDMILAQGFTVGAAATFNLADNSVDGFFPALYASLGYQF